MFRIHQYYLLKQKDKVCIKVHLTYLYLNIILQRIISELSREIGTLSIKT